MPDDGRFGGVGALLRRRREEIQQDIEDVSRQLRICSAYIRAIEEGQVPGTARATPMRSASCGPMPTISASTAARVVSDYRDELARRSRQNELVWPSEGAESPLSGAAPSSASRLLLGIAIYGGWYYATQSGGTGIQLIGSRFLDYIKKAIPCWPDGRERSRRSPPGPRLQAATSSKEPSPSPETPRPPPRRLRRRRPRRQHRRRHHPPWSRRPAPATSRPLWPWARARPHRHRRLPRRLRRVSLRPRRPPRRAIRN